MTHQAMRQFYKEVVINVALAGNTFGYLPAGRQAFGIFKSKIELINCDFYIRKLKKLLAYLAFDYF